MSGPFFRFGRGRCVPAGPARRCGFLQFGPRFEGDYGAAGSEGGLPEPLGEKAKESGRYVKADYGEAGSTPGRTAESEIGRYSEGGYGADGTVDPVRKPRGNTGTNVQK